MATEVQTAPVLAAEPEGPSALDYLSVLRRRLRTILVPAVLVALLGGVVALLLPPRYEAATTFRVDDPQLMREALGGAVPIPPHKPLLYRAESEIKSPRFLSPIIARVGLTEGYNVNDPQEFTQLLDHVRKHLSVRIDKATQGPDLIEVSYQGRNQRKVVDFVREIRKSYDVYFLAQFRERVRDWFESARSEVDARSQRLTAAEVAQQAFLESDERRLLGSLRVLEARVTDLQGEERKLASEIKELIAQENALRAQMSGVDPVQRIRRAVVNEQARTVSEQLKEAREALNVMLLRNYTEINADLKKQRELVALLTEQLDALSSDSFAVDEAPNPFYAELEGEAYRLKRLADSKHKTLTDLRAQLTRAQDDLRLAPEVEHRAASLAGDVDATRAEKELAEHRFGRAKSTWEQVRDANLFRTLDESVGNEPAVFPSVPLFMLIGLAAGLMLGIGVAFMQEFSGATYVTTAQVRSVVPVPVLGEVARLSPVEDHARTRGGRGWIALLVLVAVLAVLHVMYFQDELAASLPSPLIDLMDSIYRRG